MAQEIDKRYTAWYDVQPLPVTERLDIVQEIRSGLTGMFVLPVLAVLTACMLACAAIAPVAGVIEFAGGLFGFDVLFVMMQFGRWTMPFWLTLPASLVLGALFLGAAYGLWRALRGYVRAVSRGKSALDAAKAG